MNRKGFTLIELLIIIAIIGFLAAAILVAVDPVKRIQDSRDARRSAEANAILNAILTKQVDDRALFSGYASAPIKAGSGNTYAQVLVTSVSGVDCTAAATRPGCDMTLDTATTYSCVALMNDALSADTNDIVPNYISEIPTDPRGSGTPCATGSTCTTVGDLALGTTNSGYYVLRSQGNRIEIGSCAPEQASTISVKR
jgi:prepilin-type N-terminal cleavage/methylation domain-containing protein